MEMGVSWTGILKAGGGGGNVVWNSKHMGVGEGLSSEFPGQEGSKSFT